MATRKTVCAVLACAALAVAASASATSTDGFHTIEVVPVVVNTASFSSEIYVFNPNGGPLGINFTYYPGVGTPQAGALFCGNKVIPGNTTVQFTLTSLCPGLAAGSNFGSLEAWESDPNNRPFNVFVRVNNPQGQGFAIEGYPAHTFTAANMHVTGLKRVAAAPGYQTNCFFGALGEATEIDYSIHNPVGTQVGVTRTVVLAARQFVRVLDVFADVGAPAGDHLNMRMQALEFSAAGEPGAIVFCTVQNNTTFDADFRIGKASPVQDDHANRSLTESTDALGNPFTLGTYINERNRHVVYFKHPDWVKCSLTSAAIDLEMRLVAPDGTTVVAGGSDATSFPEVYLGAKSTRNSGANGRWFIDVESSGSSGATYSINCTSGSGHSSYELVGRNLPDAF